MADTCHAPCVITTTAASFLIFCGQTHGHDGKHSVGIRGKDGFEATVRWNYFGAAKGPPDLRELLSATRAPLSLELEKLALCCERDPKHEGDHAQSGICSVLSAWWAISW